MDAENRRLDALRLIEEITHCPLVVQAWQHRLEHPCGKVVGTQSPDPSVFQVPEPWAGHLHEAPILFISSNPSISSIEPYPVWDDSPRTRIAFFDERFGDGPRQVRDGIYHPLQVPNADGTWHKRPGVQFWIACRANVRFLLQREPEPGVDYAMTEVVHCKSRDEIGVGAATRTCVAQWIDRVLTTSPAALVVTLGDKANEALAHHLVVRN